MTPQELQNPSPDQPRVSFANNGRPTEVWFVQGKKANRAFKATLNRQDATLSEDSYHPPTHHDETKDPQRGLNQKT